tara:strand:- start:103 stop:342 length:240 start_codon:yes stop_codon:yes gene_type:complete
LQAEDNGWPLKTPIKKLNANNDVDMEFSPPSLAEADEILAKFGYVEEEALQLRHKSRHVLLWMLVKEMGRRQRANNWVP